LNSWVFGGAAVNPTAVKPAGTENHSTQYTGSERVVRLVGFK